MTDYFIPEGVFQKVVVFNKRGEVLLIQASDKYGVKAGTWDLPGGKVHAGEPLEQAIKREVKEETGITLKEIRPVTADVVKFVTSDGRTRIGIVYFANYNGKVKLSFEHTAYEWVPLKKIGSKTHTFKPAPQWIRKAAEIRKMMK